MIKREDGFSLVEMLITMVVFLLVIAAASQVFTGLLTQFKQQSKIAETNIEGIVGLDILRRDLENAGFGLPWYHLNEADGLLDDPPWSFNYNEADDNPDTLSQNEASYNDAPSNPPRALVSGNGQGQGGSDVLVIKASNVAQNDASQKWTHLFMGNTVTKWPSAAERPETSDRVIVLRPYSRTVSGDLRIDTRALATIGGAFTTRYSRNLDPNPDVLANAGFAPVSDTETRLAYVITDPADPVDTALRMPFNRADYYFRTPGNMPTRCAQGVPPNPGPGILYKATVSQPSPTDGVAGGGMSELPLLDCVADMQVVFGLDTDATPDGAVNCYVNDLAEGLATVDAEGVRDRVIEVRVYILAHEGQIDRNFTFNANPVRVGEASGGTLPSCMGVPVLGGDFDLSGIADWQNYRWKVYQIIVRPKNLR